MSFEVSDSLPPGIQVTSDALTIHFSRSGGPGGQNVNKVNTKATLWVSPAGIIGLSPSAHARLLAHAANRMTVDGRIQLIAETHRTQEQNRQAVLEKLSQLILRSLKAPRLRRPTRPTAGSKRRRLESKRRRSALKSLRRPGE